MILLEDTLPMTLIKSWDGRASRIIIY